MDKAVGMRKFMELHGIARNEVIAFGDSDNDVGMLEFAGIGVAMGNANENAKAAADFVTKHIDDDGVAYALAHFGIIEPIQRRIHGKNARNHR